jgi:hypothetical protein
LISTGISKFKYPYISFKVLRMKTKLTLSIRKDNIRRAKAWARKNNISLSEQIDLMLEELISRPDDYGKPRTPWVKKIVGSGTKTNKSTDQLIEESKTHSATKHSKH